MQTTVEPDHVRHPVVAVAQPVVRQGILLTLVLIDMGLAALWGDLSAAGGYYFAGWALLVTVSLATLVGLTGKRWPPYGNTLVLMVDLAAIGLLRLVPEGNGLGVLALLPALWLGVDHRKPGVVLTLVGTLLFVSAPSVAYFGTDESWLSRAVLVPLLASLCALIMAGTTEIWARQNRELEEQGRRLEQALKEITAKQAMNNAIVSAVDVGLVALDRDGEYRAMNPRYEEFMALAFPDGRDGQAGQAGQVFAADRTTRLGRQDMPSMRALSGHAFVDYVIWVGADPEKQRALSVSSAPIVDAQGTFDGAVLVYNDITDLMSALKVKDEFVASVSHELRTPLTAIIGFLEMVLEKEELSPGARTQLEIVERNSERLLRLVSDLLLTAQVEEGRLSLELRPTDLGVLADQAVADWSRRAASEGIDLKVQSDPSVVITVDATRMRQLVDNLVGNALKYTPPGGTVSVVVSDLDDAVELEVRDTGMGIADADQPRLFTRFFRTSEAEASAIPGIGLGLAISKAIVEGQGGRIAVESELGLGTTFRVVLPRR